jgi:hypothetical protein
MPSHALAHWNAPAKSLPISDWMNWSGDWALLPPSL